MTELGRINLCVDYIVNITALTLYGQIRLKNRPSLFGYVTQCTLVIVYRRFGTAYQSHLQRSGIPRRIGIECCFWYHERHKRLEIFKVILITLTALIALANHVKSWYLIGRLSERD